MNPYQFYQEAKVKSKKYGEQFNLKLNPDPNPDLDGSGDEYDAFRHSFTTLEWKRYLMQEYELSNEYASKIAYGALGAVKVRI